MSFGNIPSEQESRLEARDSEIVLIPVAKLAPAYSPRLSGLDEQHVRMLAEVGAVLPPILVQRSTMRVIDGMHRVRACQLNGVLSIRARLLDETDESAFMRGVQENVSHGLPLSLEDRRAAASRLLTMFPHWSDRALGRASGLSGKTVAALRRRLADAMTDQRTGQDGRTRPMNTNLAHRAIEEFIERRPEASLREVARFAGVSPNTVRSIRLRLQNENSAPDRPGTGNGARRQAGADTARAQDALINLTRDPSLRYTESGRALLRLLHQQLGMPSGKQVVETLPPHCLPGVAQLAGTLARQWASLSELAANRADLERP